MSLYLGLDSSTQGLSAVIIDADEGAVIHEETVSYGRDLPRFGCEHGFLDHPDPLVKHADPLIWAAALDLLFDRLRGSAVALSSIRGISGSGQQHGTVYLSPGFRPMVADPATGSLARTVRPYLTRRTSPIWMDSSTSRECAEINQALGGAAEVRRRSGSSAIERFAGPQIRKFHRQSPAAYEATGVIHLVSSFLCSLLTGASTPIDRGDGAGMNLLRLADGQWDEDLLRATAPDLADKLPPVVPSTTVVGPVQPYLVERYGLGRETEVVVWSGDNPNSLIGVGGWQPGTAVISLGTSDTFFAAMERPLVDPSGFGHVFGNPAGGFMCLIAFKNGSLARERVRNRFDLTWEQFGGEVLAAAPVGNNGNMMLPYFVPEITPLVLTAGPIYQGSTAFMEGTDASAGVRAVVEAQFLSMRLHTKWIGEPPRVVRVTGGASRNDGICQVVADVFNAAVERLETPNSAALGAAMRAAQRLGGYSWETLAAAFCRPVPGSGLAPCPEHAQSYQKLLPRFAAFEKSR